MSDINKEQLLINDNDINSIFERKIELGAVIQFNLLQRIIEEFIKRQKSLNDKVNNLEIKINSISEASLNPNLKEEIDEFKENINFEPNKETILKEKEDNDLNNINRDIDKVSEKDYLELDDDKKKTEKNKEIKEIKEKKDTAESIDKNYYIFFCLMHLFHNRNYNHFFSQCYSFDDHLLILLSFLFFYFSY